MATPAKRLRPLARRLPPRIGQGARAWLGRRALEVATHCTGREYAALEHPGETVLHLDYAPSARNVARFSPHPELARIIGERHDAYAAALETIRGYGERFTSIAVSASDPRDPQWLNGWQPGLDSGALYAFVSARAPRLYIEIGSGVSTKFARRAIEDGGLSTRIVSIDPGPHTEVDELCDSLVRSRLEEAELSVFEELAAGDVVFFDGSHRVFMNSDVTVFFLEVLPRLPPGVLVAIHDVYLPHDYQPWVAERYWSEQYLLAAYLLAGNSHFETILPAWYVWTTERFRPLIDAIWEHPDLARVERHGAAYWLETRA